MSCAADASELPPYLGGVPAMLGGAYANDGWVSTPTSTGPALKVHPNEPFVTVQLTDDASKLYKIF